MDHNQFYTPRRGLRREAAAIYVGISVRAFDQWIEDKTLPCGVLKGGVRLWDIRALDSAMDALFNHVEEKPSGWSERLKRRERSEQF